MKEFDDLYNNLKKYLEELEKKFIIPFIDKNKSEFSYEFDVRAFCVLSHAALENYFEEIVLMIIDKSIKEWLNDRTINDSLLMLVGHMNERIKIDGNTLQQETNTFEYLRKHLELIKREFSDMVDKNQGISLRHLRKLLSPVAINIKDDADLKNSLNNFSETRGSYSHKKIRIIKSPEDMRNYKDDYIKFCEDIKNQAIQKFNSEIQEKVS